ncbi:hypothetical protein D9619_000264 [Psilocybe cf. subviscida]|uniref:Uncharacterized protein n=1 Tax=Psilocybe cf. subviscida TaxID=2480587 RepID=A0A8H5BCW6_9AGAR|nr:hypothetical protein D9619_000264 [Psilocybe cf. subviscida]
MSAAKRLANLKISKTATGETMDTTLDLGAGPSGSISAGQSDASAFSLSTLSSNVPTVATDPLAPTQHASSSKRPAEDIEDPRSSKRQTPGIDSDDADDSEPDGERVDFVPTPREMALEVQGILATEYFRLVGPATKVIWDGIADPKFLVHIPNDRYNSNPVYTLNLVKAALKIVLGHDAFDVLPPVPQHDCDAANALYVPCLVTDVSTRDCDAVLQHESFLLCTPEANFVPLSYDFLPTDHIGLLGGCGLTNTNEQLAILKTQICDLLRKETSTPNRFIGANFDNIPPEHNTKAARVAFIAASVRIEPLRILRREKPSNKLTAHWVFNLFIHPPTIVPHKHPKWIASLTRNSYITPWGRVVTLESYFCTHCSSRTHPSGMCPYPNRITGFEDTTFVNHPSPGGGPGPSASSHRGPSRRGPKGPTRGKGVDRKGKGRQL